MKEVKYYYLGRKQELEEVKLLEETQYRRRIKFLEGPHKGEEKTIHPEGVAWGRMYPRLFKGTTKPTNIFNFQGRALQQYQEKPSELTPAVDSGYRFQNFLVHVIDSVNLGENVLLTGGTGVGKTSHIEQLAARCNQELIRVNFNGETRLSDFLGKVQVVGGETRWVDGILPMAMRNGYWLLLDEIDFADPSVLSLLHPVLEHNPQLVLKENQGEVLRPHPNFRIFATANSIGAMQDRAATYTGTNHMNEAFIDRWQVLLVPNLSEKEELKILKNKVGGLKTRWAKNIVKFAQQARTRQLEGGVELSSDNFSTRKVLAWAKKTALLRSPVEGAKLAWLDKVPSSEQEALLRIIQLQFGSTNRKSKNSVAAALKPKKKAKAR